MIVNDTIDKLSKELPKNTMNNNTDNIDTSNNEATNLMFTKEQVLERYEINSVNTLKRWCKILDVQWGKEFDPEAIAKFDHIHHHVRIKGMTIQEYESLISPELDVKPGEEHGRYASDNAPEKGNQIVKSVKKRYGNTIKKLAPVIAGALWEELDMAVLNEFGKISQGNKDNASWIESLVSSGLNPSTDLFLEAEVEELPMC